MSPRAPSNICSAVLLISACFSLTPDAWSADVIFHGGPIITMDESRPSAEAVAVRDGKILAVGTNAEILQTKSDDTQIIDLEGKTLLPGFIDPHLHPYLGGLLLPMQFITPEDWELPDRTVTAVRSRSEYLKRLRHVEANMEAPTEWLYVWGYHHNFHGDIDRKDLDAISTTRPILMWHRSFHEIFFNTPALNALGLQRDEVEKTPHTDWDRGHFYETGGKMVLPLLLPKLLEPNRYQKAIGQFSELVHRGGITTIADLSAHLLGPDEFARTKEVLDRPEVPFRTLLVADAMAPFKMKPDNPSYAVGVIKELHRKSGEKVFFINNIKLFSDGAFFSQLMQVNEPYTDGHEGEWLMTPDELQNAARAFWHAGFQIHIHTNGDKGVDVVLDILEKLQREKQIPDHRFTLEHFGLSTVEQTKRIAKLGACVSANTYYLHILGELYADQGLGPERAHTIVRSGSLVRNGVPLAFHSDMTMAPARPLMLAWCAVNRRSISGKELGAAEKVSVRDALKAITINAAYVLRQEHEIGSIEVGKRADFTILAENPLKVAPIKLRDIPVWGTVFEGRVVPVR